MSFRGQLDEQMVVSAQQTSAQPCAVLKKPVSKDQDYRVSFIGDTGKGKTIGTEKWLPEVGVRGGSDQRRDMREFFRALGRLHTSIGCGGGHKNLCRS